MKFELDCDYFNRAGDKVRYVGLINTSPGFRGDDGIIYAVGSDDGKLMPHSNHALDILGKWEITDDKDRAYTIDDREIRYDHRFTWRYVPFGYEKDDIKLVKKILIKPRAPDIRKMAKELGVENLLRTEEEVAELRKYLVPWGKPCTEFSKSKKIEPLTLTDFNWAEQFKYKINELIIAHNSAIK